jgi:hypothetical protein
VLGVLSLQPAGDAASGSLALPIGVALGTLTLSGPNNAVLTIRDTVSGDAAGAVARANGGRVSPAD